MAAIQPQKRSLAEIKAKLLNPATTSHFQVGVGQPVADDGSFRLFLEENGVQYDQDRLNLLCSEASLPGSSLATTELLNDFTGVTERHVYRRIYDDRIDLTFYTDAEQYLPIKFFESWLNYITNESTSNGPQGSSKDPNFFYRMKFPNTYKGSLEVTKFEKNLDSAQVVTPLTYGFVNCYPLAVTSMPVTYDSSDLLKCTVSMTYSRYYMEPLKNIDLFGSSRSLGFTSEFDAFDRFQQARFNAGGISRRVAQAAGNSVGRMVETFVSNLF